MDILSNLQNLLGAVEGGGASPRAGAAGGDAGGLFSPEMLGGLAGALLGGKAGGAGLAGGAGANALGGLLGSLLGGGGSGGGGGLLGAALGGLLGGGGSAAGGGAGGDGLLGAALGGLMGGNAAPPPAASPASSSDRATRLLRALVYAAKADGHIDAAEQANIDAQIAKLGLGGAGEAAVRRIMDEPLDPNLIARGVADANEAVGLYALSCAITNADHFMERGYLDSLATALRIPSDAKAQIEAKVRR